MRRRHIIAGLILALAAPLPAEAQQVGKPARVGVLTPQSREPSAAAWNSFNQGLRELGWEEGSSIAIERRFADGKFERLPALAEELVARGVSVIVAANSPGTRAAIAATTTIPIVMVEVGDPVATGFVKSLARPGGNVTGVSNMARDLTRKRLELLKQAVPRASRIAVILNPDDPVTPPQWRDTEEAARTLGVQLLRYEIRNAAELERAFQAARADKADGILRLVDPLVVVLGAKTVELAMQYRSSNDLPPTRARHGQRFPGLAGLRCCPGHREVYHVAYLGGSLVSGIHEAFVQRLTELGWRPGRDVPRCSRIQIART